MAASEPVVCIFMGLLSVVSDQFQKLKLKLIRNLKLIVCCSYHWEVERN